MPPHARNEHRIARPELRDLTRGERVAKARETLEVRIREIDAAHRLPAGCRFVRSGIQIENLLLRKQRHATPADRYTGKIIRRIVVARGDRASAEPDALARLQAVNRARQVVLLPKPRQTPIDGR